MKLYGEKVIGNETRYTYINAVTGYADQNTMRIEASTGQSRGVGNPVNLYNESDGQTRVAVPLDIKVTDASRTEHCMYKESGTTYAGVGSNGEVLAEFEQGLPFNRATPTQLAQYRNSMNNITIKGSFQPLSVEVGTVSIRNGYKVLTPYANSRIQRCL